jgi:hypothetical protein
MFLFPRNEYIARSIQKRKPMKDVKNKPILEKYNSIIDKYLFSSKQHLKKQGIEKISSFNGPITLDKTGNLKQNNLFYPANVEHKLRSLNIDDFKLPSCKSRNFSNFDLCIRHNCITPTFENSINRKIAAKYRAKSVNARHSTKISRILQTDNQIILENESQEEESPVKFTPVYEEL